MIELKSPYIIYLPKIVDVRGNLTCLEGSLIPFEIKRVYWVYDVPGGGRREGHAFLKQHEFVVALSGSFDVVVYNGKKEKGYHLNRAYFGLYLPNGLWRHIENFSTNSVAMVLSSSGFDESDYIRDYGNYQYYITK
ncbi:MAG TPA: FdtA/QdtA family cupin domain-containing protein [Bacteroidales bacterium]|nr:FdtA/QdtA family cupin domain-containing protein [Bacteroidales bacterium]